MSEIPGRILKVFVKEGDVVDEDDIVAIIESMKMVIEIRSCRRGVVKKILVKDGKFVNVGQPIMIIE